MNDENTKELIPSSINTSVDKVCEVAMKICEMGSSCSYRLSSTLIFFPQKSVNFYEPFNIWKSEDYSQSWSL